MPTGHHQTASAPSASTVARAKSTRNFIASQLSTSARQGNSPAQPMNPTSVLSKRLRFGKIVVKSVVPTPNHFASVAAY